MFTFCMTQHAKKQHYILFRKTFLYFFKVIYSYILILSIWRKHDNQSCYKRESISFFWWNYISNFVECEDHHDIAQSSLSIVYLSAGWHTAIIFSSWRLFNTVFLEKYLEELTREDQMQNVLRNFSYSYDVSETIKHQLKGTKSNIQIIPTKYFGNCSLMIVKLEV